MEQLCKLKEIFKIIYQFESKLKKDFNLSINEALTLCALSCTERSSGELAKEIGISVSRMSRVFGSLEDKGYIIRKLGEDDKRKMIFTLSETGTKKLKEIKSRDLEFPKIEFDVKDDGCG